MSLLIPQLDRSLELPGLAGSSASVWVTPRDVHPNDEPELERCLPESAELLLPHWLADPETREALERMLAAESLSDLPSDPSDTERLGYLTRAFAEERLWMWRRPVFGVERPAVFPDVPGFPKREAPETTKTWIEILLVTADGRPVPDKRYELVLPDGSRRSGNLDGRGRARVDNVPSGVCDILFPDVDGREWEPRREPTPGERDHA